MCAAYYIRDRERERLKGLSGDLERKGRREERRRRRRKMKINVLRTCWRRLEQGRERERDSGGHSPCVTNCCQPSLLWFSAYSKCRFFSFFTWRPREFHLFFLFVWRIKNFWDSIIRLSQLKACNFCPLVSWRRSPFHPVMTGHKRKQDEKWRRRKH